MNQVKPETLAKLRELILKSEGKTSEDELEFGCRTNEGILLGNQLETWNSSPWPYYFLREDSVIMGQNYIPNEILGLPITLSRILMALGKKSNSLPHRPCTLFANADLNNENCSIASPWGCANWILPSEADGQSEETILKLIDILESNAK